MEKWKGRVALVSGASAGIGAAVCEKLVKNGMNVVGAARRLQRMQDMAEKFKNEEGTFFPVECDLTKDEDVYALFDKVKDKFGGVDVCINNAGVVGTGSGLLDGTPEEWRQMIDVNVIAVCLLSKLTVKSLQERGCDDGHIINIGSLLGHQVLPFPPVLFYTGTKFALRALSEGLRQELQAINSGIKVSVVSPGLVKTEILQYSKNPDYAENFMDMNPTLKSEDLADAVYQILSAPSYLEVLDMLMVAKGKMKLSLSQ